ncbi:MAG: stage III sporulation protein AG [Bacilli bacterium]|nr:stage III sporulation protein AG [Bacilli bacterium]
MIKKFFSTIRSYFKDNQRQKLFIVALAFLGIGFILFSDFFKKEPEQFMLNDAPLIQEADAKIEEQLIQEVSQMEKEYEKNLQAMLNQISGISEVEVMVNIDSTNVHIYERDVIYGSQTTVETDTNGGKRTVEDETKETKIVYVRKGDEEVPVLLKTEKPTVRGVFIIAKGVESPTKKQMVIEAVSRVLDVPSYRISVLPK